MKTVFRTNMMEFVGRGPAAHDAIHHSALRAAAGIFCVTQRAGWHDQVPVGMIESIGRGRAVQMLYMYH